MKIWCSALISFLMCSAVSVFADPSPLQDKWLLAKYDTNGDQVISAAEIEDKRKRMFEAMDADLDGGVSFAEYEVLDQRKREVLLKARFRKLDANEDGFLSAMEYSSYLGSFERLDVDGDGQISEGEMAKDKETNPKPSVKPNADLCLLWVCVRKNFR